MKRYDVLVIGSGKGGKTLAMKLAGDGVSVGCDHFASDHGRSYQRLVVLLEKQFRQ